MKPTKQLILALRETANQIITRPEDYDWCLTHSCNCGLLVRNLLDVDELKFRFLLHNEHIHMWMLVSEGSFCSTTGLPTTKMFTLLYKAGLEKEDFYKLELLEGGDFKNPIKVAEWMNKKAEELEEQRKLNENNR